MNKLKSFPEDMPEWQAIQDDYNERISGDIPYSTGMAPQEIDPAINQSNYMDAALDEASNQQIIPDIQDLSGPLGQGVVESGQVSQQDFDSIRGNEQPQAPMSAQEKMMAEYKSMQDQDRQDLQEARSSDRNLKMGGAIGDALATYLNAKGQMKVKAPGVQVQQGAGLGKIADMFATAPDAAADIKSKREDLLAQYKVLSKGSGDMTPYQKAFLAMKEKDQALREQSQSGTQGRHEDTFSLKQAKEAQLSDKVATSFADMQTAKEEAKRLLPKVKEAGLGLLGTPIEKGRAAVGLPSKEFQALEADYAGIRNTIRNSLFGSALTGPEITAFEKELNDISVSQSGFEDNLTNFIGRVERKMAEKARNMAKAQPLKEPNLRPFMGGDSSTVDKNQKALDWANANPNDPRSAAILKKLGM